jgi:hypothetical protein
MLQEENPDSVPKCAKACMIPRSTEYELRDLWNESDGTVDPGGCKKKNPKSEDEKKVRKARKLDEEYTDFIVSLIDADPTITLELLKEELVVKFQNLIISVSGLHKHVSLKCALSPKTTHVYTMESDTARTLNLCFDCITQWKAAGVDFQKNCEFMDEAGFNFHQIRNRGWAKVRETPMVKVPPKKGVNISIIGCISPFGTINFSEVEPLQQTIRHKSKRNSLSLKARRERLKAVIVSIIQR